jgi:exosortase H (IPTLxxWG-CTERM-specific)
MGERPSVRSPWHSLSVRIGATFASAVAFLVANRAAVRFSLLFPALLFLTFAALRSSTLTTYLVLPFATLIARLCAAILDLLGAGVSLRGTVITGPGVALEVIDKCSAIYEIGIFWAAVIAYPARMKPKVLGAVLGAVMIFVLSLLRVLSLFYIGRYVPTLFEKAHIYVGQSFLIILIALLWIYWVERYARAPARGT